MRSRSWRGSPSTPEMWFSLSFRRPSRWMRSKSFARRSKSREIGSASSSVCSHGRFEWFGTVLRMDDKQAQAIVGMLSAYYPKADLPDSTVIVWALQLKPYRYEDAKWAVEQHAASSKWLPALSDLIGTIRGHRADTYPANALPEGPITSRILDRVQDRLSPCDDDLAFLDARREQHERDVAVSDFRTKRFRHQTAAGEEWERVRAEIGEGATDRQIGAEVHRIVREKAHKG